MSVRFDKTVIVGTGLIGGSVAIAGKRAGSLGQVVGVGRSRANLDAALQAGIVDSITQDLRSALVAADLVVLAAPVDACLGLLSEVAAAAPAQALITDVGSVKQPICRVAVELGLQRRFVGVHPMAGGTSSGAQHASAELFADALVVVTPESADDACVARVVDLWHSVGARTLTLDADSHDRNVALVSHLTQMLAFALPATAAASADPELAAQLAAAGFRDTARLATSDAAMWQAIAALNRDQLVLAMDGFSEVWLRLRAAVAKGDAAEMGAVISAAAEFYRRAGQ